MNSDAPSSSDPLTYDGGRRRPDGTFATPRRYSLGTIFIVTGCFAALMGIGRAVGLDPISTALIVGLLITVGLAQALLFRGRRPRLASVLAGIAWGLVVMAVPFVEMLANAYAIVSGYDWFHFVQLQVETLAFWMCWTPGLGYLAGGVVAGTFLIMDAIEKLIYGRRHRSKRTANPLH